MANYYTHFCIEITGIGDEEARFWNEYDEGDEDGCCCFDRRVEKDRVYLSDADDGSVFMDHVAQAVSMFLRRFRPLDTVVITYADTCDKHRLNAFGGGVLVVTASDVKVLDAASAGADIAAGRQPTPSVASLASAVEELALSVRGRR